MRPTVQNGKRVPAAPRQQIVIDERLSRRRDFRFKPVLSALDRHDR